MRIIHAYTLQRVGFDAASGILDWMLTPYYLQRNCPNDTIILYTNEDSAKLLGELWPYIRDTYDEVHTDLVKPHQGIFSAPKFEAMQRELDTHGPNFAMVDNDVYAFPGFLENLADYGAYYKEDFLINWYHSIADGKYDILEGPSWITWKAIPYNCAVIRINDAKLLQEYIDTFYSVKAERLIAAGLERAIVKEQWTLGELFEKYNILPVSVESQKTSLHKGRLKMYAKPSQVLAMQEYLAAWLMPKAFKVYKNTFGNFEKPTYDINWCFDSYTSNWEKAELLAPVFEKIKAQEVKK